jgi:two-component system NtrC family sensor kinase
MNAAAFDRHGIELARDFAENLPPARVDRHKVLQILINLLRNAKYAMDKHKGLAKTLVVRVGAGAPGRVKITVADSGIGIDPENLTRIFNHGFTTKSDGHGFGLHSGANAAREMGGSLTAHSDGPGRGAEFTLELPTAAAVPQPEQPAALLRA